MGRKFDCSECGKEFGGKEKGYKIVPKPLCPRCVDFNKEITCRGCNLTFKKKESYLDECWTCKIGLCDFCKGETIEVKGMTFSFCKEHLDYDIKEVEEDAQSILDEEEDSKKPSSSSEVKK